MSVSNLYYSSAIENPPHRVEEAALVQVPWCLVPFLVLGLSVVPHIQWGTRTKSLPGYFKYDMENGTSLPS